MIGPYKADGYYEDEKQRHIFYFTVVSGTVVMPLYSFINKTGKIPVGYLEKKIPNSSRISVTMKASSNARYYHIQIFTYRFFLYNAMVN